jgi:hypothetical protein
MSYCGVLQVEHRYESRLTDNTFLPGHDPAIPEHQEAGHRMNIITLRQFGTVIDVHLYDSGPRALGGHFFERWGQPLARAAPTRVEIDKDRHIRLEHLFVKIGFVRMKNGPHYGPARKSGL